GFEFVNGFHDTANAVATVIYTHSLPPNVAVVWSGLWNLIGVLVSSGAVAYGIVALLPIDLVMNVGSASGFAMVFALLISAIVWNLGTWYLGLPASSSHTMIGSILGVGLANSMLAGHGFSEGVNWGKAKEVGISLFVSPVIGFVFSALLLFLLKALIRNPKLFTPPEKDKAPPGWIRGILVLTCTGVSYFHGSNDGQKGMGLIVLILVGVLPGTYALKLNESHDKVHAIAVQAASIADIFAKKAPDPSLDEKAAIAELESFVKSDGVLRARTFEAVAAACRLINQKLQNINSFSDLSDQERRSVRNDIYGVASALEKMDKAGVLTDPAEKKAADAFSADLDSVTKYIPAWVKIAVACALGLGTMVGWKRIVVTVGEKIGKSHLTYGQGAAAELVAAATIKIFDNLGLPVSTTHVLSSGVAGTMAANGSGLQAQTLRNILLAWVLTLPVCIFLGSMLFAFGNFLVFHVLGLH
ncbi:MAG TPA: inorganic phosphate transporter, partial [Chthoniobacteraceae bacterium]